MRSFNWDLRRFFSLPEFICRRLPRGERLIFVGDIHGCAETLRALLQKLELKKRDIVVFLGDYVSKGPNSYDVIEQILELRKQGYNVVTLAGNHEMMLCGLLNSGKWKFPYDPELLTYGAVSYCLPGNGLNSTLDSYRQAGYRLDWDVFSGPMWDGIDKVLFRLQVDIQMGLGVLEPKIARAVQNFEFPQTHIEFLENLDFCYGNTRFNASGVHAQFPGEALACDNIEDLIAVANDLKYQTEMVWGDRNDGVDATTKVRPNFYTKIHHGHEPYHTFDSVLKTFKATGKEDFSIVESFGQRRLDTSCGYGGPLSCSVYDRNGFIEDVQEDNLDMPKNYLIYLAF